jgi:hypothetical protein
LKITTIKIIKLKCEENRWELVIEFKVENHIADKYELHFEVNNSNNDYILKGFCFSQPEGYSTNDKANQQLMHILDYPEIILNQILSCEDIDFISLYQQLQYS